MLAATVAPCSCARACWVSPASGWCLEGYSPYERSVLRAPIRTKPVAGQAVGPGLAGTRCQLGLALLGKVMVNRAPVPVPSLAAVRVPP